LHSRAPARRRFHDPRGNIDSPELSNHLILLQSLNRFRQRISSTAMRSGAAVSASDFLGMLAL